MNAEHAALYNRIQAFVMDDPDATLPFTERLAQENGWTRAHAERVVEEYRKFVLLAVSAGHPVTPSDAVDQAWHQHLTYTRSYWQEFCPQVLGRSLHHQPTRGGPEEKARFSDDYTRTLASYQEFFGERPPSDIWPEPARRFPPAPRPIAPRPIAPRPVSYKEMAIIALCIVAYLAISVGLHLLARRLAGPRPPPPKPKPLSPEDIAALWWFLKVFAATALAAGVLRWFWRRPAGEPEPEELDLDPYETAYLAGGDAAARCAALTALAGDGLLTVSAATKTLRRQPQDAHVAHRHVMEQAVWRAVDSEQGASLEALDKKAPIPDGLDERLRAAGLVLGKESAQLGFVLALTVALLAPIFGVLRMLGVPSGAPTAVLILPCFFGAGLACGMFGRPLHRSRRGDRALAALKTRHADLKDKFCKPDATLQSNELACGVGLFGTGILAGGPLTDLHALMKPHVSDDGVIWVWHESAGESGDGDGCGGGCGCG